MSMMRHITVCLMSACVVFAGCKSGGDKPKDDGMDVVKEEVTATPDTPTSQPATTQVKYTDPGCVEEDEMCRVDNMGKSHVGWLDSGVTVAVMLEKLGEPDQKEARINEEATGDIYEIWIWTQKGVRADLSAPDMTAPVVSVRHFTVTAPFDGKTERGIGIGSTEAEVLAAYPGVMDPNSRPGAQVIVGSIYGGMFFDIVDGNVTSIFVGAGAE